MSYSSLHLDGHNFELSSFNGPTEQGETAYRGFRSPDLASPERQSGASSHLRLVPSRPQRQAAESGWLRSWRWEVASIFSSIFFLVSVLVVLLVYNNHAVPSLPASISLNAIISLLATASKGALLFAVASSISQLKWHWFSRQRNFADFDIFDGSSRGPRGSMLLLFRKGLPVLATLGALVTVLAVTLDPFIQQVISYSTRQVVTGANDIAVAPRAQQFDMGLVVDGGVQPGPDFGMKAAIYSGLFTPEPLSQIKPSCITGNCTFPLYDSLAICSKCLNVTETTKLVYHSISKNPTELVGLYLETLIYGFPGGYNLTVNATYNDEQATDMDRGIILLSDAGVRENVSRSQLGIPNPLNSLALLQFPTIEEEGYSGDYLTQTPLAWQCSLFFCLNLYNVSMSNGNATVAVVDTWHEQPGTQPSIQWTEQYLEPPDELYTRPSNWSVADHPNATFWVPSGTAAGLSQYLNHLLSGSQLSGTAEVGGLDDSNAWMNDVMQALGATADVAGLMAGFAASMTTYLQTYAGRGTGNQSVQAGAVLVTETYVRVRWGWFALPLILVLASAALLAATVRTARRDAVPIWKSSGLAAFFHGLEDEGRGKGAVVDVGAVNDSAGMAAVAEGLRVRLEKGGSGWKMVVVNEDERS